MAVIVGLLGAVIGVMVAAFGASWYATRSGHPLNLAPVLVVGLVGGALGAWSAATARSRCG